MATKNHKSADKSKIWFNQIMTNEHDFFVNMLQTKLDQDAHPLDILFEAQALSALVGFDFTSIQETLEKLAEEAKEVQEAAIDAQDVHLVDELGDVLFSVINVARHLGLHPRALAHATAKKYLARCAYIEQSLEKSGRSWKDLSPEEIKSLWAEAKSGHVGENEFLQAITPYLKKPLE